MKDASEVVAHFVETGSWDVADYNDFAQELIKALEFAGLVIVPIDPSFERVSEGASVIWETATEARHELFKRAYMQATASTGDGG